MLLKLLERTRVMPVMARSRILDYTAHWRPGYQFLPGIFSR